jgi:hypothetical protein
MDGYNLTIIHPFHPLFLKMTHYKMRMELTIFVGLSKMFETVNAFHCHMMFLSLFFDEHVSGHAMEEKTRERAG